MSEDSIFLAEKIHDLQKELKEARKESDAYCVRLWWENWWTCVWVATVICAVMVIFGYPIYMSLVHNEIVGCEVRPAPDCPCQYRIVQRVNWNADNYIGTFSSVEEAKRAARDMNCPGWDEEI